MTLLHVKGKQTNKQTNKCWVHSLSCRRLSGQKVHFLTILYSYNHRSSKTTFKSSQRLQSRESGQPDLYWSGMSSESNLSVEIGAAHLVDLLLLVALGRERWVEGGGRKSWVEGEGKEGGKRKREGGRERTRGKR